MSGQGACWPGQGDDLIVAAPSISPHLGRVAISLTIARGLIVEDHPDLLPGFERALTRVFPGIALRSCGTLASALACLRDGFRP